MSFGYFHQLMFIVCIILVAAIQLGSAYIIDRRREGGTDGGIEGGRNGHTREGVSE